jgi:hypothetical protein
MIKYLGISAVLMIVLTMNDARADDRDFTLINKTGYEITAVYIGPNHSDDWGPDIMGRKTLDDGDKVNITFRGAAKGCHWDLKVDWADDSKPVQWLDIDLCSIEKITLKYNRSTDETTALYE